MYLSKLQGSPSLELIYLVLDKKARGEKVVSLAVGDPSFQTPKEIIEVAYQSMLSGDVHYVSSYGTMDIREAIRNKVQRKNSIKAKTEHCIFVTTKFSVYASLLSISETPFDALIPNPGYFYSDPVILAGGNPIYYNLADDFSIDLDEIRRKTTEKTKVIIINSPSNPVGKVFEKNELQSLYDYCREKQIYIISDEAYEDLVYEKKHFSIGSLEPSPDFVISIFSLSKSYAMTGWRAGYVVAGPKIISPVNKFLEHTVSCFPPFIEKASAYALNNCDSNILEFKKAYKERRDFISEKLEEIPSLKSNPIEGAFYAFPKYASDVNSINLSKNLLQKENVAVLPGISFGPSGEHHIRLSFSGSMEEIDEGMKRIKNFFTGI
ncbi:MAG: pyridoxal phosphate-dependent aminotransferase [archaeon]|nr:pyridoxal phosphate-dependent aminotransferase [archaeon]